MIKFAAAFPGQAVRKVSAAGDDQRAVVNPGEGAGETGLAFVFGSGGQGRHLFETQRVRSTGGNKKNEKNTQKKKLSHAWISLLIPTL